MYVKNKEKAATVDKAPTVNVVFLGDTVEKAKASVLHLTGTGASAEVRMTGLHFEQ